MSKITEFQKNNCLDPDGDLGEMTVKKMQQVFSIKSKEHMAHFMGQLAHESGNFTHGRENLNYSAQGLLKIFRKYFTPEQAAHYARNPIMIGNRVYANRMGNGDESSGDGYHFRGAGPLQLTGKNNTVAFSKSVNNPKIIQDPDLIVSDYYFESALFFFKENNLWRLCSQVNEASISALTLKINGGYNGLQDRVEKTEKYYRLLS